MTHDLPAMRRFKDNFRDASSSPLAMWLSTELAPTFGRGEEWDPFVTLVADVEAEGNALVGAKSACSWRHGTETPAGDVEPGLWLKFSRCPGCGAAL